jgi:hypothetical protein
MPFSEKEIRELAARWVPALRDSGPLVVHTDTTDFFRVEYNEVVLLEGRPLLVRQNLREGRFGIDDEVKHWVKRAIDLPTGEPRIIKLVHHEKFTATVGGISFECFRSPRKEARILALVVGHPHFMQGFTVNDTKGNPVRVLEVISGPTLAAHIENLKLDHEGYFHTLFPAILDRYLEAVRAIAFLHRHNEKHGDIRRDHLFLDRESGLYRWIDFDFNYRHRENIYGYDLFGLGNVLIFLVGKGDLLLPDLRSENHPALDRLESGDVNIVFHHRVANLKKVFPYLPDSLNRVLLHFSLGAPIFYEHTGQLIEDLEAARADLAAGEGAAKPLIEEEQAP